MTTEAGRRLLVWLRDILTPYVPHGWMDDMGPGLGRHAEEHIAAIEAEARAALLAELEAGVLAYEEEGHAEWISVPFVLDLIRKAGVKASGGPMSPDWNAGGRAIVGESGAES